MPKHNITKEQLRAWGKHAHHMPQDAEDYKKVVLSHVHARTHKPHNKHLLRIAFATLIVVVAFIGAPALEHSLKERRKGFIDIPTVRLRETGEEMIRDHGNTPSIQDTRTFMEITYHADIQTRDVEDRTEEFVDVIERFGGRIDEHTYTKERGFIRFVIPADVLPLVREAIADTTLEMFLEEELFSKNLLPQKQNIEQSQSRVAIRLREVIEQQERAVSTYENTITLLTREAHLLEQKIATAQLDQVQLLQEALWKLQEELMYAEQDYVLAQTELTESRTRLAQEEKQLVNQDQELMDRVATVRGTITITHISFFDLMYPYGFGLLIILFGVWVWWYRRRRWYDRLLG